MKKSLGTSTSSLTILCVIISSLVLFLRCFNGGKLNDVSMSITLEELENLVKTKSGCPSLYFVYICWSMGVPHHWRIFKHRPNHTLVYNKQYMGIGVDSCAWRHWFDCSVGDWLNMIIEGKLAVDGDSQIFCWCYFLNWGVLNIIRVQNWILFVCYSRNSHFKILNDIFHLLAHWTSRSKFCCKLLQSLAETMLEYSSKSSAYITLLFTLLKEFWIGFWTPLDSANVSVASY